MPRYNEEDFENLAGTSLKWQLNGDLFAIQSDSAEVRTLPAGAYSPGMAMSGPYMEPVDLKQEELIPFTTGPCNEIVDEVNKFWNTRNKYDQIGVPYRRGILMYGPPGTGKSGIVRLVAQKLINDHNGLVMIVKDASLFSHFIPLLNKLEPNRRLVIVLEDVEKLMHRQEQDFLQLLDGISNDRPGMLFIATTNYLAQLEPRVYRPSRFDLLVEVGMPDRKTRETYVKRLCQKFGVPYNRQFVDKTNGLSFAALKEIIVSCLVLDKSVNEMVKRMRGYDALAEDMENEED